MIRTTRNRRHPDDSLLREMACPLCSGEERAVLYRAHKQTGTFFGRLTVTVVQCADCGAVYNSPRPGDEALERYYAEDSLASGGVIRASGEGTYYPRLLQERALYYRSFLNARRAPGQGGRRLLDVGCGTGGFLEALASVGLDGWSLEGLEPSEHSARELRRRGREVTCARLGDTAHASGSFDAVSLIGVLEHLTDPRAAMGEVARLLRPGGLCLLEVPNTLRPELSLTGFFGLEHVVHYSPSLLARLLGTVGLGEVYVDRNARPDCIRLVASADLAAWGAPPPRALPDDREDLAEVVRAYGLRESAFLVDLDARVNGALERWKAEGRHIAIYGAGAHTAELSLRFDLLRHAECVLDGDARKQGTNFLGLPVAAPEELAARGIDAVLISSHRFAEEMEVRVRRVGGAGVDVQRCYGVG